MHPSSTLPTTRRPALPRSGHESPESGHAGGAIGGSAPHRVAILVYDGVKLLDDVGPAEVFGEANRLDAGYTIVLVSPTGPDVTSSIGIGIGIGIAVDAAATEPAPDTFLVADTDLYPRTPVPRDLIEATRTLSLRAGRVASICTGALILGAAGLLDGKRATTHWKVAHQLAAHCRASRVKPDDVLACWFDVDRSTITRTIGEIRPLLVQRGCTIAPGLRLRTLSPR
ncbi:DJ-1/PfpI family protein [Streptomyces sp. NPDC057403]|uniref:DJ-1/PfpI family protein n=1 Tax=Streptomyces sp. NPDC057403 TaxID=3346119 RepID=UPI003697344A